jgi:hypothetical protein
VLAREALDSETAQRLQQSGWEAALVASGLPLVGLDTPRARPRFAAAAPLAAAIPGEAELMDTWLTARLPRWSVREALLAVLPPKHRLVDLFDVWLGEAALPGRVAASVYRAELESGPDAEALRAAAGRIGAARTLPRERRRGEATVAYDLRPFVETIEIRSGGSGTTVTMVLRHDPEKGVGRPDELLAALADAAGTPLSIRSLVRERLVLAVPPPAAEPAPRGRGPRPRAGTDGLRRAGRRP